MNTNYIADPRGDGAINQPLVGWEVALPSWTYYFGIRKVLEEVIGAPTVSQDR